ncbi:MAG: hypothetical protein EYC70_16240 [Planctomycetota bacterium]|nr:MAG: hypothetical protein EYC70_16240 [Planctomycetota bacterium]
MPRSTPSACLSLPSLLSLAALLAAGCSIEIDLDGAAHHGGGYSFDHEGVSLSRHEEGAFATAPASVEVVNKFGWIKVEASEGSYGWSWDGEVWADDSTDAETFLRGLLIRVDGSGDHARLEVTLPEPDRDLNGIESNLLLRLPAGARVHLRNEFGPTFVREIRGRVEVRSGFGAVEVRGAGDEVDVHNSFARIDVRGAGAVSLRNEHGAIVARDVRGNADIRNGFGPVELECYGAEVTVENEFAQVDVELRNRDARRLEVDNSFGAVEVEIPGDADAQLQVESSFGDVETYLSLPDQDDSPFEVRMSGGPSGAGLHVRVSNEHGTVRVRRGPSSM